MLETSSSPAAEAMIPFASPMLASLERLLSRLALRVAGPQSQFTGRALQFADRIFSRRLDSLGMGAAAPERQFAERTMEPQSWLLPKTWVPSAAALRGGPASAQLEAPQPENKRAVVPPLVLPPTAKPPETVVKPAGQVAPVVAAPAVTAPATAAAAVRAGLEVAMPQVAPSWTDEKAAPATPAAAKVAGMATPAGTAGPTAATAATKIAPPVVSGGAPAATVTQGSDPVATVLPAADVAAPGPLAPLAAVSPEIVTPPVAAVSSASPAVAGSTVAAPTSQAESRPAAAATLTPGPASAAPASPLAEVAADSRATRASVAAGAPVASVVANPAAPVEVSPAQAGERVATEQNQRPQGGVEAAPISARPTTTESATVAPLARAASVVAGVTAPIGAAAMPETRVRDLLAPQQRRTPVAGVPAIGHFSAFSRSLGHLGWSDDRLGRAAAEKGQLPSLNFEAFGESTGSPRAAIAPTLAMVKPDELTPRVAARAARQVNQPFVAPEKATPPPAVAASRQPVVALPPSVEPGMPAAQSVAAAPVVSGAAAVNMPNVAPPAAESVTAGLPPVAAAGVAPTVATSAPVVTDAVASTAAASASGTLPRRGSVAAATLADVPLASLGTVTPPAPAARVTSPSSSWAAPAGLGAGSGALSPSLLASPALNTRGPASLVELFLSGQSARAGISALGTLPSLAATQPYRTPGALASYTERMATAIGTHVTAGSAGVDNPFGGEQRWSVAPGLTRSVARALGRAEAAAPGRWTQLSSQLPYLEEPGAERPSKIGTAATAPIGQSGPSISRVVSPLTMAPAGFGVSPSPIGAAAAPMTRTLSPELTVATPMERGFGPSTAGAVTPTRQRASAAEPSFMPSAARPWQLAGGMATLAELFAAGVGVGTGAAGDLARQAGVAPAGGLMPPWLTKAAKRSTFGLAARELTRRNAFAELEYVSDEESEPEVKAADPMARAMSRAAGAMPSVAAPSALALAQSSGAPPLVTAAANAVAPAAAALPPAAASARTTFWQHAGGLAATAEAFAGGHGIGRMSQGALGTAASVGHWVPVTGGMVFISDEPQRPEQAAAAAAATQLRALAPSGSPAAATSRPAATAASSVAAGAAWPLPNLSGFPQALPNFAAPEATAAAPGLLSLGRGVDWGRAGGLGLRTELFAAGLGSANLGAQPLSTARDLTSWSAAPGVATPLARALRQSEPTAPARWTLGTSGLLFISEPGPTGSSSSVATAGATAAARNPLLAGAQSGRPASPVMTPSAVARPFVSAAQASGATGGEGAATMGASMLNPRPWLQPGGTAILAELFAAGVGLGSGAASDMAQQAGVAAGRGPLPSWLSRIMSSSETVPSSLAERLSGAGAALPFVPRDERQPGPARVLGALPTLARQASLGLPMLGATPVRGAVPPPLNAAASAADRRPLPVTATAAPALWQRAGGLAASAEAFARGRGMESTEDDSVAADDQAGEAAGRWLPVSGGLVFVPRERPAAAPGKAAAARPSVQRANLPTVQRAPAAAAAPAARATDWQRAGGLGLRSELFAANLGQSAAAGASSDPLGGWASSHRMLTSFPQQSSTEESPTSRFAWNGPGGLLYLAGESPAQRRQRAAAPTVRRANPAAQAAALAASTAAPSLAAPATRAERFSTEFGADGGRSSERAVASGGLPLTALFGGREGERTANGSAGSSPSGAALPASLASAMLTSFPRSAAGGADSAAALWPRSAMQSADRLSQLLAQLPAQWTPSAALAATMQASGAADASLWQRLSPNLLKLAGAALRNNQAGGDEEGHENMLSERQPQLTMVKGGASAAPQKPQRAAEPAWKQQTAHGMVSAALQKVAGSGTPMATAAKMLESIRGSAGGQSPRSDDRISLGDMTLIALSMGENKMAAATQGHSPSTIPHVESAMRQGEVPSEPEDEHTLTKKVNALAKMVLKYVDKNDQLQKERGDFDA